MSIKVKRIFPVDCSTTTKAYVDITYFDMTVRNCKVVKGRRGLFVSMPQEPGVDDARYYNIANPETAELKTEIKSVVLAAYEKEVAKLKKL